MQLAARLTAQCAVPSLLALELAGVNALRPPIKVKKISNLDFRKLNKLLAVAGAAITLLFAFWELRPAPA